jgi:hypothetical protein
VVSDSLPRQDVTAEWTPPPVTSLKCLQNQQRRGARDRDGSVSFGDDGSRSRRRGTRRETGSEYGEVLQESRVNTAVDALRDVQPTDDGEYADVGSHEIKPRCNLPCNGGLAGALLGRSRRTLHSLSDFLNLPD